MYGWFKEQACTVLWETKKLAVGVLRNFNILLAYSDIKHAALSCTIIAWSKDAHLVSGTSPYSAMGSTQALDYMYYPQPYSQYYAGYGTAPGSGSASATYQLSHLPPVTGATGWFKFSKQLTVDISWIYKNFQQSVKF